jgi:hypothetical protein
MSQWDQIVRSIIESIRSVDSSVRRERERTKRTEFLEGRKRPNSAPPRPSRNQTKNEIDLQNSDSGRKISNEMNSFPNSAEGNSVSEIDQEEDDDGMLRHAGSGDHNDGGSSSVHWNRIDKSKSQKVNQGQGRIQSHRAEILADKYHWKKIHSKEDKTALSSIASLRLQQYLEAPFVRKLSEEHQQSHSPNESNTRPSQSQRREKIRIIPKDSKFLSSGSSSLEIANAFLQSHLGQDLVQNHSSARTGGESPDQDSDQDQRERGMRERIQGRRRGEESETQVDGGGHGVSMEDSPEFYKAYYSQDWQSRKGGWVGDFGPPHTHPLSIRKEKTMSDSGTFNLRKY